jgi:hypothetical protein
MGNPRDQDDEEAECKRKVRGPERDELARQAARLTRVRKTNLEDQERNGDGKTPSLNASIRLVPSVNGTFREHSSASTGRKPGEV